MRKAYLNFLFLLFTNLFLICCLSSTNQPTPQLPEVEPQGPLSILQGATDSSSTQINLLVPKNKTYRVIVELDKSLLNPPQIEVVENKKSKWQILNFKITGLTPDLDYHLKVYDGEDLVDSRLFRVFPKDIHKLKLAVISCTDDQFEELQKKQWQNVWKQKPDALFLIGDNVYVDSGALQLIKNITDDDIWHRYAQTRNTLDLYKMKNLIPVFATWDDHDYGTNNGDMTFPYKEASQKIFQTFFPMAENEFLKKGPGVSSSLNLFKHQFLFLDDRSFRSPSKSQPDSHFGKNQEDWLFQSLAKYKGPSWIISGDQFFGGYHHFESYEGDHPISFKSFLQKLKSLRKIFVFLSGDRHVAEVMTLDKKTVGLKTYELTSSGLHSRMYPGSLEKTPNPKALFGLDGTSHFLILDIEKPAKKTSAFSFEATFRGEEQNNLFQKKFSLIRN